MFTDSFSMSFRRIAFIFLPIIVWVLIGYNIHIFITESLGKNAGSSYRLILTITFYYGSIRKVVIRFKTITINDDSLRTNCKLVKGAMHSKKTSIQDINPINFFGSNNTYSPSHSITNNLVTKFLTTLFRKFLRIVKQRIIIIFWQNYCCSINTSC